MTKLILTAAVSALVVGAAVPALAQSKGDILVGVGVGYVSPSSDNGTINIGSGDLDLDVGDDIQPTLTLEYFVMDNIGIEVLAATPFSHDIKIAGDKLASTKQLPPTISVQYHIPTGTAFTPLVGIGVNYTTFWDEDLKGALNSADLSLGDSWGVALHAGVDYAISDAGSVRADVRWVDLDSTVKVNGDKVGTAEIDPWVFGLSYIFKF